MASLEDNLKRLRTILSERRSGYVAEVDKCLADIAALQNARSITGLLDLLDDAAPDELMFSIVHSIEKWDDSIYSTAVLESVDRLWKSAPRWAQILHIRIMNSQPTADTYFAILRAAPRSTRLTVRMIFETIGKGWPQLASRVKRILTQLPA